MHELHENEQYFFDAATLDTLAAFLVPYPPICCLCAPLLGKRLGENRVDVTILDIDDRFSGDSGFHHFDIFRPEWHGRGAGATAVQAGAVMLTTRRHCRNVATIRASFFTA